MEKKLDDARMMGDIIDFWDKKEQEVKQETTVDKIEQMFKKLQDMGYNLEEMGGILEEESDLLVLSGAGAGKTTVLILKIIHGLESGRLKKKKEVNGLEIEVPAEILVCTFLKSGAEELRDSFLEWCGKLGVSGVDMKYIHFKTIHAEVYQALKEMGIHINLVMDTDRIVRSVMKTLKIRSVANRTGNTTIDEVNDIASLISFMRNRLDSERYNHPLMMEYGIDKATADNMLVIYKQLKMIEGVMDFEDLQEILLEGLQMNPNVVNYIQSKYDYVFVDEFQDTSQLQYEILKYYFDGAEGIFALGDDDQCIYSWRGSDIEIITKKFAADYKPEIMQLNTNYRCSSEILKAVIPSISKNTSRAEKELKAFKKGGKIELVVDGDVTHLLENIRKDLERGETVGVLARTNAELIIPSMLIELDEMDISYGLSKSVSMTNRMPQQVLGVVDLVTKRYTPNFESTLQMFIPRYKHYQVKMLCEILYANKELNLYNISTEDIKYSTPDVYPIVEIIKRHGQNGGKEAYIELLTLMEEEVYKGDSMYASKARDFVYYIRKILQEHPVVQDMTLDEVQVLFRDTLPAEMSKRKGYKTKQFLNLTTVHEAKGKEWDNVYIWNNVDGSFPNSVGKRPLTKSEFEEERRVHYIAWTRAKKKLMVYTRSDRRGGFLDECDLDGVGVINPRGLGDTGAEKLLLSNKPRKEKQQIRGSVNQFNDYYRRYTDFSEIGSERGYELDLCETRLGDKHRVFAELDIMGVFDSMGLGESDIDSNIHKGIKIINQRVE